MHLQGVRVVDLTRILSGPFCTLLLADMGAEVIKVEPPGGDPLRAQGVIVEGLSWYFAAFNRNKRSIVLNLRSAAGQEALRRLIATVDVVVDNFQFLGGAREGGGAPQSYDQGGGDESQQRPPQQRTPQRPAPQRPAPQQPPPCT